VPETTAIGLSDLHAQYRALQPEIDAAMHAVLEAGEFERGTELRRFEAEFARFCGAQHAVAVGTGHAALFLALRALGIGPGDEVITVPNTDISTCAAISQCGARIVWADVREETFTIDPWQVADRISTRTRAIIAVHLYGLPADMSALRGVADPHGIPLIEDAALACGATIDGRRVGSIGRVGCFSFAPHKILGAYGDGGMITTDDADLAAHVRLIAGYGEPFEERMTDPDGRFVLLAEGYHSHLDLLQAAVLRVKLRHLEDWIAARLARARLYDRLLADSGAITPSVPSGMGHVYRTYVVRVPRRDRIRARLAERGIETGVHYVPPLHLQPVYRDKDLGPGAFPVVERLADELLCLPLYPELPEDAVRRVAAELRQAMVEL
jgi:dTDP-4-amino-4,6-dideoxygalactose transaminase